MPFGVVSVVGPGIGVSDGDPHALREREIFGGGVLPLASMAFLTVFLKPKCILTYA